MTSFNRNKQRITLWFLQGIRETQRQKQQAHEQDAWWKVMCLTGVDYFSSLGYAPGIAYLAAGLLSPIATIVLVLLTLLGALPVYCKVAAKSPHGQGSISMLENLIEGWRGKLFILCLLGFAATDFIITITLSAADAATHLVLNPWMPHFLQNRMLLTMVMLAALGAIFLKGFKEAIGVAVVVVTVYLILNFVVLGCGVAKVAEHPEVINNWVTGLYQQHGSVWQMIGISCLLFPKLALGMSGFETGVAVMPHIKGDPDDTHDEPRGRIRYARYLLRTAAVIMSTCLLLSSFVTTVLIPKAMFAEGQPANGRALAYLAHDMLGDHFGTLYDFSSIAILWFAGASAMAGLLNLVPRYLPRFGMAPDWARATRPLVLFFTVSGFIVTWAFNADVDKQGGAYATGVLVLMTSAAIASALAVWKEKNLQRYCFLLIMLVFAYTTITNAIERPDGVKIASVFIAIILFTSFISRALRSTELRVQNVALDATARNFINEASKTTVRLVAHRPGHLDYAVKTKEAMEMHNIKAEEIIFLEVEISDASDFGEEELEVEGHNEGPYRILRCSSPAVPNAMAALLIYIRDKTRKVPHIYMGWTEGNPLTYIMKYLFLGEGETAPITREVLREAVSDPEKRPRVHVG